MPSLPRPSRRARLLVAALGAAGALVTSGCSVLESNDTAKSDQAAGPVTVESSSSKCDLSADSAKAGNVVFRVHNTGQQVTEFYLYDAKGSRIIGEVENIGPGLTRELVVRPQPGKYVTACKPGMKGNGIRGTFTVTGKASDAAVAGVDQAAVDKATSTYAAWVRGQADRLLKDTKTFATAYKNGDDAQARAQYPDARMWWERIEPVAESFGDLDQKTDLREADLEKGQKWTGWHRIEKDLWPPASGYARLDPARRARYADDLVANIEDLHSRVQHMSFTVAQIASGSKSLTDEVASGKVTGEEETWSHTDLYDFAANVEGAQVGYQVLSPILDRKNPALSAQIKQAFEQLTSRLDGYKRAGGYESYTQVNPAQRKQLSDEVNALAEPLSQMTAAVTS